MYAWAPVFRVRERAGIAFGVRVLVRLMTSGRIFSLLKSGEVHLPPKMPMPTMLAFSATMRSAPHAM